MPSAMYSRMRSATGLGVADQRGAGAAAHETDACPQVWADLQLVAPAAVQRGHPALADGVHAARRRCCAASIVASSSRQIRSSAARPGFLVALADDDVQADAEADSARPAWRRAARTVAIFSATSAGGSPQVRYLSTCSAATAMPAGDEPPK